MPARVPPSDDEVRDLEILVRAHHPLILVDTEEVERATTLVQWVADRLNIPYVSWSPDRGLRREDLPSFEVKSSEDPRECLKFILEGRRECLYHLRGFEPHLQDDAVAHQLVSVAHKLFNHRGAIILSGPSIEMPAPLGRVATCVRLSAPTQAQYYDFVNEVLRDIRRRLPVKVEMTPQDVALLLNQLQGLTLFEVKKVLTKAIVEDARLSRQDISKIAEAKKEIVERSGVLEYFTAEESMAEIAGLTHLKAWLSQRKVAFTEPDRARQFGLSPPRGILLLGVQGCGKSMCAKAIASEWALPLIRLDPSNLYNKFFGESEKNLKRATRTAESMAPIVLWIDEMEKAFAQNEGSDSGTSSRIFGSFLSWMQEKKEGVFVVGTSNDITKLPPELVRKGRFDEIFFVDLPSWLVRRQILVVHLAKRGRDPSAFDLDELAQRMEGFSGAEVEQVVLSSLYAAFAHDQELTTQLIEEEIARTVPLSVTASEKIQALREWASDRAVPAG